jgi:hypothetical protein
MVSDTVRVLAAAGLAVAAASGPARAVVLVPIAVVLGAGEGLFMPGSFAIIPALLPDADLQSGNALVSAGTQLATLVGPALGGTMVALLGPSPAFGLDAASFALSALTLARVRAVKRDERAAASIVTSRPAGPAAPEASPAVAPEAGPAAGAGARPDAGRVTVLSLLRSERALQVALLVTVVANLGSGGIDGVALPSLAHGPLHTGAGGFGALIAAFGAGALLGTLVSGHFGGLRRPAVVGSIAFLIEALFMGVAPYLGGEFGVASALLVLGAMNGFGNVVTITAFQRWAPPDLLGRLAGVLTLCSLGVYPISVELAAAVVHGLGPAPFFPLAGTILAVAILIGLSQRSWRNFGMPTETSSGGPEPHTIEPSPAHPSTTESSTEENPTNPETVRYAS